jgi:hypothetical protein
MANNVHPDFFPFAKSYVYIQSDSEVRRVSDSKTTKSISNESLSNVETESGMSVRVGQGGACSWLFSPCSPPEGQPRHGAHAGGWRLELCCM